MIFKAFQSSSPGVTLFSLLACLAAKTLLWINLNLFLTFFYAVSISDEGRAEVNGLKASHFFSLAERLNVCAAPFIWLFIRPPWSLTGSCCKAVVYESLKAECQLDKVRLLSACDFKIGWELHLAPLEK